MGNDRFGAIAGGDSDAERRGCAGAVEGRNHQRGRYEDSEGDEVRQARFYKRVRHPHKEVGDRTKGQADVTCARLAELKRICVLAGRLSAIFSRRAQRKMCQCVRVGADLHAHKKHAADGDDCAEETGMKLQVQVGDCCVRRAECNP